MKSDFKVWEWRYGRLGVWWDWNFWGLAIIVGTFYDSCYKEIAYRAFSIRITIGPIDLEAGVYLPPGKLLDVGGYQG